MKRFKDFFGNEITDPWFLNILQQLDQLKKRNKGRKNFSEEDKKELDSIAKELETHWQLLKKELDKIPKSELARRIHINDNNRLFDSSTRRRSTSAQRNVLKDDKNEQKSADEQQIEK